MADPGWVGAYGAAGGYEYLANLIAERKKDELLQQRAYEFERQQALQEQEARQRADEFRATQDRLRRYEETAAAERARTNLEQRAERIRTTTPIGQELRPLDIATLQEAGYPGTVAGRPITRAPGLIETIGGAPAPAVGPETGGELIYGGDVKQRAQEETLRAIEADESLTPTQKVIISGEVRSGRGVPGGIGALFKKPERTDAEEIAYQGALAKARAAAEAPYKVRPEPPTVVIQTVDPEGNPVTKVVPKTPGAEYARPPSPGLQSAAAELATVPQLLDRIDTLSAGINVGSGLEQWFEGKKRQAAGAVNLDDQVRIYDQTVSGFRAMLARLAGHVGVLTAADVEDAMALVPAPQESKQVRDDKIRQLRAFMNAKLSALPQQYRRPQAGAAAGAASSATPTTGGQFEDVLQQFGVPK